MSNELSLSIRWKWLIAGAVSALVVSVAVWLLHGVQVERLFTNVLSEARSELSAGNHEAARQKFQTCVQLIPHSPVALEECANMLLLQKPSLANDLTAMKLLDAAFAAGATGPEIRLKSFRVATRLGRYTFALGMIAGQDLSAHRDPEILAMQGLCHLKSGDYAEARLALNAALAIAPEHSMAWKNLVALTEATDGKPAALAMAERMAEVMDNADGLTEKARRLEQADNLPAAGIAYWEAAKHESGDFETAKNFADFVMYHIPPTAEMDLKMVKSAYQFLNESVAQMDYSTAAQLADLAHRLERYDEAIGHYRRCLEFQSKDPFALGRITEVLIQTEDFDQAHETLDHMADTLSVALLSSMLRGQVLLAEGQLDDARQILQAATQKTGNPMVQQGAYYFLVQTLWELQDDDAAVNAAAEMLRIAPDSDNARELYSQTLIRTQRFEETVNQFQQFRQPEDHLPALMLEAIQAAQREGRLVQLEGYVRSAGVLRAASSIPKLFRAWNLSLNGRSTQAVALLIEQSAVEPTTLEYRSALKAVRDRIQQRLREATPATISDVTDSFERRQLCLQAVHPDQFDNGVVRIRQFLVQQSGSVESLQILADVVRDLAVSQRRSDDATTLMTRLSEPLRAALQNQNVAASRLIASAWTDCGQHRRAAEILVIALNQTPDAGLVYDLSQLAGGSNQSTAKNIRDWLSANAAGQASHPVWQALTAEMTAFDGSVETAISQLTEHLDETNPNLIIALSLLRLDGYSGEARSRVRDVVELLRRRHPENADVLHACACSLRTSRKLSDSLQCSVRAYSLRADPRFLLHAAYTRWLMGQFEEAEETIRLAKQAGLTAERLNSLDQTLLETLLSSPELKQLRSDWSSKIIAYASQASGL